MYKILKILIAGDSFMKSDIIKIHLQEILSKVDMNLNIRTIEWTTREYQKNVLQGVRRLIEEFSGDPKELAKEMGDTQVLVVHAAPVTVEVLDASKNLKIVACTRGGAVNVDVDAATDRGIPVINTPGRNADAVADYTIGFILAETRSIARAFEDLRKGNWKYEYYDYEICGYELAGKSLGLIGFGQVGRKVAQRAKGFEMNVLVYDPYVRSEDILAMGCQPVDLEKLLKESDFVSIHARLTPSTVKMIGAKEIALMKKTAYLINTARGRLVDQKALYEALENRRIAGAALDVFENEPLSKSDPILTYDNVTITPHIGGAAKDVVARAAKMVAEDIKRLLEVKTPLYCVNPSALSKWEKFDLLG
ncbi:MAG: 2-hydroxyacid dehydrogenase [Nitrososphaeria archaeon]